MPGGAREFKVGTVSKKRDSLMTMADAVPQFSNQTLTVGRGRVAGKAVVKAGRREASAGIVIARVEALRAVGIAIGAAKIAGRAAIAALTVRRAVARTVGCAAVNGTSRVARVPARVAAAAVAIVERGSAGARAVTGPASRHGGAADRAQSHAHVGIAAKAWAAITVVEAIVRRIAWMCGTVRIVVAQIARLVDVT